MSTDLRDHIRSQLDWARMCTDNLLETFPAGKATFRTGEHDLHATWILGHLALTEGWVLGMLTPGGRQKEIFPEEWVEANHFGYGSTVQSPDTYPAFEEVLRVFRAMHEALLDWLDNADDEALGAPLDDGGTGFAKTPGDAISRMAWHEGWHAGQLSTLRRALGLSPAF